MTDGDTIIRNMIPIAVGQRFLPRRFLIFSLSKNPIDEKIPCRDCSQQGIAFNMNTLRTPFGIILYPQTTWYKE